MDSHLPNHAGLVHHCFPGPQEALSDRLSLVDLAAMPTGVAAVGSGFRTYDELSALTIRLAYAAGATWQDLPPIEDTPAGYHLTVAVLSMHPTVWAGGVGPGVLRIGLDYQRHSWDQETRSMAAPHEQDISDWLADTAQAAVEYLNGLPVYLLGTTVEDPRHFEYHEGDLWLTQDLDDESLGG